MKDSIRSKLQALDWSNSTSVQLNAIHTIAEDDTFDPTLLLQDSIPKECWGNASIIFAKWGSPRIDVIIPGLLKWLQDINWPGALEILVLLYDLPEEKTAKPLQDAIVEARRTSDEGWLEFLEYFTNREEYEQEIRCWLERHRKLIADAFGGIYP
jgi:hypothetical protein